MIHKRDKILQVIPELTESRNFIQGDTIYFQELELAIRIIDMIDVSDNHDGQIETPFETNLFNFYKVYQIYDCEFNDDLLFDIWMDYIHRDKFFYNRRTINAEDCIIKELSTIEMDGFNKDNNIMSSRKGRIKIGLFYENELVQSLTISSPSQKCYKGKGHFEIVRRTLKKRTTVNGGISALMSYFENKYQPLFVIAYDNARWDLYHDDFNELKIQSLGISNPNYFYHKDGKLFHRMKFQKHKLKHLEHYSENLTESEIMLKSGYRRIYDSGNYVYIKTY